MQKRGRHSYSSGQPSLRCGTASGVGPNGRPAWTWSLPPSLLGTESPPEERVYGEAGVQLGLSDPEGTRGRLRSFQKSLPPLEPARSEFVRSPFSRRRAERVCSLSEQVHGKVYKGGWTVALVRSSRSEMSRGWKFPQNKNVTPQTCTGAPRTAGREAETRGECDPPGLSPSPTPAGISCPSRPDSALRVLQTCWFLMGAWSSFLGVLWPPCPLFVGDVLNQRPFVLQCHLI